MQIGSASIDAVLDGEFVLDRDFPYPGVTDERWAPYSSTFRDGRQVVNQLGGYLVRSDDYVALIDLGFGPTQVPTWRSGKFLDSLETLGVGPSDVTDVFLTHLHFDHIGWATVGGDPVFSNATHRCHRRDWDYFTGPDFEDNPMMFGPEAGLEEWPEEMATTAKLRAIEHLVEFWDGSTSLPHGVDVLEFPGHTPGTTAVRVTSQGESALFIGDIAHHQAELVEPDIHFIVDMDPDGSASSQAQLLGQFVDTGTPVAGAHFRSFEWGHIVRGGSGYAWSPLTGSGVAE